MANLLPFITAMVISMILTPLLIRIAPFIGMMDQPDPRKVHEIPVPRVGGIGIVIGSLIPLFLWVQFDQTLQAYIIGSVVLLIFGIWDDSKELGHYVKFVGQFIAVLTLVFYGDVYITQLPFIGLDAVNPAFAKAFTVVAIIGMINAINHSDGLDGLAGGMSLLSLAGIGYLAYLAESFFVMAIVFAVLGGIFGFLRYNNHPAKVFMGDGGSQFLGFTLGFLAVVLTQKTNTALSPALPLLFLGLPIIDILAVFYLRVSSGQNWFRATKNHIHHRLLELGFDHYESVIIIYSVQILFIVSAIFLQYDSDYLISIIYLGVCSLIFILLTFAERRGWRTGKLSDVSALTLFVKTFRGLQICSEFPIRFIAVTIPVLILAWSLWIEHVPHDVGITATVLAVMFFVLLIVERRKNSVIFQIITYVLVAFVVYLEEEYPGNWKSILDSIEIGVFVLIALAIALIVRYEERVQFKTNPMDFLIVTVVLVVGIVLHNQMDASNHAFMLAEIVILFYGCSLIFEYHKSRWNPLTLSSLMALTILGVRGLV